MPGFGSKSKASCEGEHFRPPQIPMSITFRHTFNADRCFDIGDDGPHTVKSLFGEMAPLLFTFLIDVHILGGDEVIEAGALVTYYIEPVRIQMFLYDDRDRADLMVKLDVDASANPLEDRKITNPKYINKLTEKQHAYKLTELCAAILPDLEAAMQQDQETQYFRWIIDGIREQMRAPPVAKRNALHEMHEKGRTSVFFVKTDQCDFGIRLKSPVINRPSAGRRHES